MTTRRDLLRSASCGFGYLAFCGLAGHLAGGLARGATGESAAANPLAERPGHFAARAKRVIFLFMQGGPSHVDSFDYKPELAKRDGQSIEFYNARARQVGSYRVLKSPWKFAQYGQSGRWVSELFPHMARHVDDFTLLHSMHTEGVAHGPATLFLHTGATNLIRPSVGAWVTYGLGSENENLPGFVTIAPSSANGGPRNYSNGFLPAAYQGTTIGRASVPVLQSGIRHIANAGMSLERQRRQLDFLQSLNRTQTGAPDDELEATIASYELAFRMQMHAPPVMDLATESAATLGSYGIGQPATDDFGRQCLLARRFVESGVRYVQVNYADNGSNPRWDQHSNLKKHEDHARAVDQPVAALLADLKSRGLLDDTLVWWGGEFGRTPFAQGSDGRDHNPKGFTVWLAGGGIRRGGTYGSTDEFGAEAVENRMHMRDLHATLLHALGVDHERLTFHDAGRDYRLTDLGGQVAHELFA